MTDNPAVSTESRPPEGGPLSHWRVLIPRPADRSAELSEALRAVGAQPVSVELISIVPPADQGAFDRELISLTAGCFTWIGFTSANAVDAVLRRAVTLALAGPVPVHTRVAAVGPATAGALRNAGLPVDLVPPAGGSAQALAAIWPAAAPGDAVLLPRSDIAPAGLPQALTDKGYRVVASIAYRTAIRPAPSWLGTELSTGRFDAVLFTSPSTVQALDGVEIAGGTVLGAIGRPTATAVAQSGRTLHFTADHPTPGALVDGLVQAARVRSRQSEKRAPA